MMQSEEGESGGEGTMKMQTDLPFSLKLSRRCEKFYITLLTIEKN